MPYAPEPPEPPPLVVPYYYTDSCTAHAREGDYCIGPDTPLTEAIAMTIYNEGGGLDAQLAVNLLQIMDNLLYGSGLHGGRAHDLALLMSRPYYAPDGAHPGWNGWGEPFPQAVVECTRGPCTFPKGTRLWREIRVMVMRWAGSGEIRMWGMKPTWAVTDLGVLYCYSGINHTVEGLEERYAYLQIIESAGITYRVYFLTFPYAE